MFGGKMPVEHADCGGAKSTIGTSAHFSVAMAGSMKPNVALVRKDF